MVLTFEPVPAQVLRPDRFPGRICSTGEKLRHISRHAIDAVTILAFTVPFSKQTPDQFMSEIAGKIKPAEMLVGEGFALGRDRAGTIDRLSVLAQEHGFTVNAVSRLQDGGTIISSSEIRRALAGGDVARAAHLLGRPFSITGNVIHGAHLGRTIGFPTANVEPASDLLVPKDGIYASLATVDPAVSRRPAMTYIGTRPTVNTGGRLVETHLLDFDGDLYDQQLHVELIAHIRDDQRFDSLGSMVSQLKQDERATRNILQAHRLAPNSPADAGSARRVPG
jgi:riboflavin kinase/FMN adenylyltransferase